MRLSVQTRFEDWAETIALYSGVWLDKLCRAYWYPLYVFIRRSGHDEETAKDLTQGFNNTKFPPLGDNFAEFEFGGGDPDQSRPENALMLAATNRPLWPYAQNREVFKCPADRGFGNTPGFQASKSAFATGGTSYRYNENPWCDIRPPLQLADPINGLATKPESWIPEPSKHIVMNDPQALPYEASPGVFWYHSWHYPSGSVTTILDLKNISKKTVAPVLFVDGHAKSFNLKEHFRKNPRYPAEPTPDGIWYKAKE